MFQIAAAPLSKSGASEKVHFFFSLPFFSSFLSILFNSGAWTSSILGMRMSTDPFELPILLAQHPESLVLQTRTTKPSSAGFVVGFVDSVLGTTSLHIMNIPR